MSTLAEVAPLHLRRDVFIPPSFFPWPLSWIGPGVGVGVGVVVGPVSAQYLPPVLKKGMPLTLAINPPQTIISFPVHTAVKPTRPWGASVVVVATQLSAVGLYLPPVRKLFMP